MAVMMQHVRLELMPTSKEPQLDLSRIIGIGVYTPTNIDDVQVQYSFH